MPIKSLDSLYPAKVIDNKDPERRGRLKVRATHLMGDPTQNDGTIEDEELPWAEPNLPGLSLHIPDIDSWVWVEFIAGDINAMCWTGQFYTAKQALDFSEVYDESGAVDAHVVRTPEGHKVKLKYGDLGFAELRTNKGAYVRAEDTADGAKLVIETPSGHTITVQDGVESKVEIKSAGERVLRFDDTLQNTVIGDAVQNVTMTNLPTPATAITTPGLLSLTGSGLSLNSVGTGSVLMNFAAALAMAAGAAIALVAGQTITLTASAITLIGAGGVLIGSAAGAHRRLVTESLLVKYNTHTHVGNLGAPTSGPAILLDNTDLTTSTRAN